VGRSASGPGAGHRAGGRGGRGGRPDARGLRRHPVPAGRRRRGRGGPPTPGSRRPPDRAARERLRL